MSKIPNTLPAPLQGAHLSLKFPSPLHLLFFPLIIKSQYISYQLNNYKAYTCLFYNVRAVLQGQILYCTLQRILEETELRFTEHLFQGIYYSMCHSMLF